MMIRKKVFATVFLGVLLALALSVLPAWGKLELTIVYSNNINGYVQPCPT